jgi:hypothetical protein
MYVRSYLAEWILLSMFICYIILFIYLYLLFIRSICYSLKRILLIAFHSEVCFMFLYDSCVRNISSKSCKRRFRLKYPGVLVQASSAVFKLVKKVDSATYFLDKKYTT